MMRSQGIKGPPYRFLHGSTKEIIDMRNGVMINPMELSHHIFPTIQPHIYSWKKLYGKSDQQVIKFELLDFWYGFLLSV